MSTEVSFTVYRSKTQLSKQYSLNERGEIIKNAIAQMFEGEAERRTIEFKDLVEIIDKAKPNEALGFGVHNLDMPDIVPVYSRKRMINGSGGITRSKEYLRYEPQPGVIMLDYDPRKGEKVLTPVEIISILTDVIQEIGGCERIIKRSNSCGIVADNIEQAQEGGIHIYIPVFDASDIPRFGKLLFDKLWLKGYGHIELSKCGSLLVRSVIDSAVFSPERLDFIAPPIIVGKGLKNICTTSKYTQGKALDTRAIPDMPKLLKERLEKLIEKKKLAAKPQQKKVAKQWVEDQVIKMVKTGESEAQARKTVSSILNNGATDLKGSFALEFTDLGIITVDQVLQDLTLYDGKSLADPVEGPAYGRTTAMFFANIENGRPFINSMAHGGCRYFLQEFDDTRPIKKKNNVVLDSETRYNNVDLLRHLPNNFMFANLVRSAAGVMHLPTSTVLMVGLSCYSALTSRAYSIRYEHGGSKPVGLYCIAEQPSGTSKTRCMNEFLNPITDVQVKIKRERSARTRVLEAMVNLDDDEKEELNLLKKNRVLGLYHTNSTAEAIEIELESSGGCFSAMSSEQGLLNSLLGFNYNANGTGQSQKTSNNDLLLNGFDGGYMNSARVSRKGYNGYVIGAVCVFAQDFSVEKILEASNGTGLSERFLLLSESHYLGTRDHKVSRGVDKLLQKKYRENIHDLTLDTFNPDNIKDRTELSLTGEGYDMIYDFKNHIEPRLLDGADLSHSVLRGAASKADMQIMKIAANLHLLDHDSALDAPVVVADKHVTAAIGIVKDLLENMIRLCNSKNFIGERSELEAVLSYLSRKGKPSVRREIINSLRATQPFKSFTGSKTEKINDTLDKLILSGELVEAHLPDGRIIYSIA